MRLRSDGDVQVEYHVAAKRGTPFEALFLVPPGEELASCGLLGSRKQLPGAVTIVAAVAFTISLLPLGLWVILVGMPWIASK